MTTLLLLRTGYSYVPYSSLERIVEDSKDQYYTALRRAQATLDGDESQLIDWLTFFIRCLVRQKEVLERKIERERLIPTVREAAVLTGASRNTIKDHLKRLVDGGRLTRRGRGRGTWYEKP